MYINKVRIRYIYQESFIPGYVPRRYSHTNSQGCSLNDLQIGDRTSTS